MWFYLLICQYSRAIYLFTLLAITSERQYEVGNKIFGITIPCALNAKIGHLSSVKERQQNNNGKRNILKNKASRVTNY